MNCPDETFWADWMSGALSPRRFDIASKHAEECERCREQLRRLDAEEAMIREALKAPIDWKSMASRVCRQLREDGDAKA